jgi:copper oxidase (laccase) domain-containing protein
MSERLVVHRPIGGSIAVAEGNAQLGNFDPRFSNTEQIRRSRSELLAALGTSVTFAIVPKSSSDFVDVDYPSDRIVDEPRLKEISVEADALITRQTGVGLMLNPADCMPLVMYHTDSKILSLTHVGWRGAANRFHQTVLDYIQEAKGGKPGAVKAYLGPSISARHFTSESLSDVQENDPEWEPFTHEHDDGFHIDIPGFVTATLVKHGVEARNIIRSQNDTGAPEQNYFSFTRHKREPDTPNGRNGFAAMMHLVAR